MRSPLTSKVSYVSVSFLSDFCSAMSHSCGSISDTSTYNRKFLMNSIWCWTIFNHCAHNEKIYKIHVYSNPLPTGFPVLLHFSKHGLQFSVHKYMGKTGVLCKKRLIILGTHLFDRLNEVHILEVHILTPNFNTNHSRLLLPSHTFPPDFLIKILYILQSQWINSDCGSPDQKFHVRLWTR